MSPLDQARAFVLFLLGFAGVPEVEFAAARYGPNGKVEQVELARAGDFERVLPWLRFQNAGAGGRSACNVWVRPHRDLPAHRILMLDDVRAPVARRIAAKYAAALVETSPWNFQVWLVSSAALGRDERQFVLRQLCALADADPGATSEPRWGRPPGFRNTKPAYMLPGTRPVWTNLRHLPRPGDRLFDPSRYLSISGVAGSSPHRHVSPPPGGGRCAPRPSGGDRSRRHFWIACELLRRGASPDLVSDWVAEMALADLKRRDPGRAREYADRTVRAAALRIGARG